MITIPEVVEKIVKNSPYLEEVLSQGLLNNSALARQIKPRIEKELVKPVTAGAIIMALNRLSQKLKPRSNKDYLKTTPDMIVRSNLFEYTIANSRSVTKKHEKLLSELEEHKEHFLTITTGIFETTIIASEGLRHKVYSIFKDEEAVGEIDNVASITIKLTKEIVLIPGYYAHILKLLAWEGVNITEVVSTYLELTIILDNKDLERAFSVLKSAFTN